MIGQWNFREENLRPNWFDNLLHWYFLKRWKPIFKKDLRLLAAHILELEEVFTPSQIPMYDLDRMNEDNDDNYFEEPLR